MTIAKIFYFNQVNSKLKDIRIKQILRFMKFQDSFLKLLSEKLKLLTVYFGQSE
jgi:hypothetical protein